MSGFLSKSRTLNDKKDKRYLESENSELLASLNTKPEYLFAELSTNQVAGLTATSPIRFDKIVGSNGILLNTTSYQATLTAGKTYELRATMQGIWTTAGDVIFAWYDSTNSKVIGKYGRVFTMDSATQRNNIPTAYGLITPTTDINVYVRITTVNGTFTTINSNYSSIFIKEIK